MATTITPFDKKHQLASGLLWQVERCEEAERGATYKRMVDALVKGSKENTSGGKQQHFVAQNNADRLLQNLGFSSTQGVKDELYSLAIMVNALAQESGHVTWIALLNLSDDLYWFCSAINGVIPPDSDVVGTMEEVKAAHESSSAIMQNDVHYFLGEGFADADSDPVFLHEWLEHASKKDWQAAKLNQVGFNLNKKALIKPIAFAVLAIGAVAGVRAYQNWKADKEMAEFLQEQQATQERLRAVRAAAKAHHAPLAQTGGHPAITWVALPTAGAMLDSCLSARAAELISPAGWKTSEIVCSPSDISATFVREEGRSMTSADLAELLPQVVFMPGGDRASVSYRLSIPVSKRTENPLANNFIVPAVLGPFQSLGLKASLNVAADAPPAAAATSAPVAAKPATASPSPYRHYKLVVSGTGDVSMLRGFLDSIPTLRLSRINLTDLSKIDLEGDIYAQ